MICDICKLEKEENDFIKTDNLKTNSLYNGVCKECIEELKKHALEKDIEKEEALKNSEIVFCEYCKQHKPKLLMNTKSQCKECNKERRNRNFKPKPYIIVERKICCQCKEEKDISEFSKNSKHKDGHASMCKSCNREYSKKYRISNRDKLAEKKKQDYHNDENRLEKGAKYRQENREKIRADERERNKKYRYKKNKKDLEYRKRRLARDPIYALYKKISDRLRQYLKNYSKHGKQRSTKDYIQNDLLEKIGNKPSDSHHLDHIIPLRAFDPNDDEMIKLAHLPENLRWLDGDTNNKKLDSIDWNIIKANDKLLEIAGILKLTEEDHGKFANIIFPIIDGVFIRRM